MAVALGAWIGFDLFAPRTAHLKEFDADEVARLETAMWRSYYEKQRLRLFNQLSELLRTQYNMPSFRSYLVSYYGANAAFVFQKGKQIIRDTKGEAGEVTQADWQKIDELLHTSWRSLSRAVKSS